MIRNKYILYLLIFTSLIFVYIASFYSGGLWDDYVFIFNSKAVTESSHPFVFFNYKSDTFRAWPLGYMMFWLLYSFFSENFVIYKVINIVIHFSNFIILRKLLKQWNIQHSMLISLIFLFHPLHVETVSWIFQLNTIFATTFLLLSLIYYDKSQNINALIFFSISILFKSYAIFFPFFFLIIEIKRNHHFKSIVSRCAPFFFISLFVGLGTLRGVSISKSEAILRDDFHKRNAIETKIEHKIIKENITKEAIVDLTPSSSQPNDTSKKDHIENTSEKSPVTHQIEFKKVQSTNYIKLFYNKVQFLANSLTFYLTQSIFTGPQFFFYQRIDPLSPQIYLNLFILFSFFTYLILKLTVFKKSLKDNNFIFSIFFVASWLPVSGLFYVPFMKFADYADHWAYLMIIPISILIVNFLDWINREFLLPRGFHKPVIFFIIPVAFFCIKTINYSRIFNDHDQMLRRNIIYNEKNTFLRRYLATHLYRKGEMHEAVKILERAASKNPKSLEIKYQLDEYKKALITN